MRNLWLAAAVVCVLVASARAAKCNCNCPRDQPICAKNASDGDVDTFPSECALRCYNCTHGKNYRMTKRGACSAMDTRRTRRAVKMADSWTRMLRAKRDLKT